MYNETVLMHIFSLKRKRNVAKKRKTKTIITEEKKINAKR